LKFYKDKPLEFNKVIKKTKKKLINTVYTHIISSGVFPLKLELNTMDNRVVENKIYNFFVPDEISP